ncbi:hypothetical protein HMPREF1547_03652 [Blautia sp. KLE 1732]|nr:hypothetical protein HMPREF1547_03652 [Blautia sp. KLE 1732]
MNKTGYFPERIKNMFRKNCQRCHGFILKTDPIRIKKFCFQNKFLTERKEYFRGRRRI